ncbi:MAG: hypothetical protein QXR42_09615, partial [Candidatus Bathyarchaeia archaeon]
MRFNSVLMHVTSASIAVFLFFCIVFAMNVARLPFYLDYKRFEMNIVIFTPFIDKAVWAFSGIVFSVLLFAVSVRKKAVGLRLVFLGLFVLVVASYVFVLMSGFDVNGILLFTIFGLVFLVFSFWHEKISFGSRKNLAVLVVLYGMFFLILIEVASLGRWIFHLFSPSLVFSDNSWSVAFAEAQIWSALYFVLPVLMMIFAFSWVGELTIKGFFGEKADSDVSEKGYMASCMARLKPSFIVVTVSVAVILFIGYYHFAVSGLFNYAFPGTDIPHYVEWLNKMKSMNAADALGYASRNDRFLYLVLQYVCCLVSGLSSEVLVTFVMPVILVLLLMFATFWLVKCGGQGLFVAASSMLVTA